MARPKRDPRKGVYRRVYESITRSKSMATCSLEAELAAARLLVVVDMWGRCLANSKFLNGILFPERENVTNAMVAQWLDEWERIGFITRYEVDGVLYLQVCNWDEYQPDCVENRRFTSEKTPPMPSTSSPAEGPESPTSLPRIHHELPTSSPAEGPEFPPNREEGRGIHEEGSMKREEGERENPLPPSSIHSGPIPKQAASDAEQLLGRALSDSDQTFLRRWANVELYPEEWIVAAIRTALERQKRKLVYVDGILRGYRSENGPGWKPGNGSANRASPPPPDAPRMNAAAYRPAG